MFYWPEERYGVHEVAIEPAHLARLPVLKPNPAATDMVQQARRRVLEAFTAFGCAHFQIGRTYPYRQSRDATAWNLIEAVKQHLDPSGVLNPGVLGLGGPDPAA